jgi:TctA family transporter
VGLFAIPEIIDLAVRETAIAGDIPSGDLGRGAMEGVKDTFRHFWLTARCSILGVFMGILPGIGGSVGQWLSYAHSVQSAKTLEEKEGFGKGDVRGVLGPGASNNSKEAGQLIPTIAFGIPAGPSMAVLLGGLMLMGIIPGPDMLTTYLPLTFSMVWTIVLTNILCVLVCLLFLNRLARLTTIRANLIIPFLLLLIFIGGYAESGDIGDIILVLISGAVGYIMVTIGWPRAPFILGFIMGKLAERYLYASVSRYDYAWLYRPWVMVLFLIAFAVALYPFYQGRKMKKRKGKIDTLGQAKKTGNQT